jgi:hypothetical protein
MTVSERDDTPLAVWTERVIFWLFVGLPIAMPAHILINHVTRTNWNWPVSLLYPEVLGTFLVLALASRRTNLLRTWAGALTADPSLRWLVGAAAAFTVWTAVCAVAQGAFAGFWVRALLIGWIVPALLAGGVFALGPRACATAWRGLSLGVVLLLVESIALYVISFGIPRSFHEVVYLNRTSRVWLGLKEGVYFGILTLGNTNDIAVFFAIAVAAASGYALAVARRGRTGLVSAFIAAALVLEYLCYSRGVILCLLLVLMSLISAAVGSRSFRRRELGVVVLVFVAFFGGVFSSDQGRRYWVEQFGGSQASSAAFRWLLWTRALSAESVTKEYRGSAPKAMGQTADVVVVQAQPAGAPAEAAVREAPAANVSTPAAASSLTSEARTIRSDVTARVGSKARRLILGYGLGNYGIVIGATFDAGTHNMFMDALVASGVLGLVLFSVFWLTVLYRVGREGWRHLRTPAGPPGDRGLPAVSALLAVVVITGAGLLVNFKFENLGMMLNGAVVWLLVLTLPDRAGHSRPAEVTSSRVTGP